MYEGESSRREKLIQKWLPFWETLGDYEKVLYYKNWELGIGRIYLSLEDTLLYDSIQGRNGDFMKSHFTPGDHTYLERHKSLQWHLDLIAELSIRSTPPGKLDEFWRDYAGDLVAKFSEAAEHNLVLSVSSSILELVARDYTKLWQIGDREFEELIAEVFAREGYEVTLTKKTRDNGYDIIAVQNSIVEQRLLIECKRKRSPEAKIPIGVVREAYGALELSGTQADKLVLVSTNYYTPDARRAVLRNSIWRVDLRDYDDITHWIGRHGRKEAKSTPNLGLNRTDTALSRGPAG